MKILHLIDSGGLYGAERMLISLALQQQKQGCNPVILSIGKPAIVTKPLEEEAIAQGLQLKAWRMKPGLNIREINKIVKWAQLENFDVLHSHGYKFNILLGLLPKLKRKLPTVATLHGYVKSQLFSKMWLNEKLDRIMINRLEHIVLVSSYMLDDLPESYKHKENLTVINNGVDIESIKEKSNLPADSDICSFSRKFENVVLGVGRLSPEKGFSKLITAFEKVLKKKPSTGLIIVGQGKCENDLHKLCENLQITNNVYMPGYCQNVPALMKKSTVLVMPSKTEGLPIAALEAMALCVPIISTQVGELPKLLDHGRAGILINSNHEAFENVLSLEIIKLLEDDSLKNTIRRRQKEIISNKYSIEIMACQYLKLYMRLKK
ncbi:MAG: glycosyltransferase [Natronospirillum sp.]|uniref:glycosyltransferase n=1 Tax=Natronospirillum sp. TaxID=2812955 RepID=UPI0025F04413|nr:glycosyltransferase [Natronospirillum sp.]MCH8551562.1 glycosyltransferase [Natronospirillum sp.]